MAFADYYSRTALAAAQILSGFSEPRIRAALDRVTLGIAIGADAAEQREGKAIVDLLARLLARFYPKLAIRGEGHSANQLAICIAGLAQQINPNIEIASESTLEIGIGTRLPNQVNCRRLFVGSSRWDAYISDSEPRQIGNSANPFGAGAAACLGAANVFRSVFLGTSAQLDTTKIFSTLTGQLSASPRAEINGELGEFVLVGAGAIGNGTGWALARVPMSGLLHIVDHQTIDLGNLQRYVMAERRRENTVKVDTLTEAFAGSPIRAIPHQQTFANFVNALGYRWPRMLLALDSAADRRAAQASLPKWVANGWTQPGDLGVSEHDFLAGACVSCLYLPDHALENEDQIIASALNMEDSLRQIRALLATGEGLSRDFLQAVGAARRIGIEQLLPFEGRPIRSLYSEGLCGGAIIPLGSAGLPRQEVHVPLAHQSCLSGVLLAAAAVKNALGFHESVTQVSRVNVMSTLGPFISQAAAKDPRGICICQDKDYIDAYKAKYECNYGSP